MHNIGKKIMEQTFFNYNLKPRLDISNFFVGKTNINAFNILIKENSLNNKYLLIGPKKSGKTHLSQIWADKQSSVKYNYINMNEIINSKKNVIIDNFLDKIIEEDIFHIINHCDLNKLKILITSSQYLNSYKFKISDLSSRLKIFNQFSSKSWSCAPCCFWKRYW